VFAPVDGQPFGRLRGFGGPGLWHAFSLRHRGVSAGPYASLNLGLHVGDEPQRVLENRRRLLAALGKAHSGAVLPQQVHGANVTVVTARDGGAGILDAGSAIAACDGLVTAEPGLALMALFADCAPVFFYSARRKVVGLAHAGWRGVVAGVAEAVLQVMAREFGVAEDEVQVAIGPCIGPCCYRIGTEVAQRFEERGLGQALSAHPLSVDLTCALRLQLQGRGVRPERVVSARTCTSCRGDLFFSHRRDGGRTGRMAAVIGLEDG